jgi:hypothetical protein
LVLTQSAAKVCRGREEGKADIEAGKQVNPPPARDNPPADEKNGSNPADKDRENKGQ